jgi:hypothetical protein
MYRNYIVVAVTPTTNTNILISAIKYFNDTLLNASFKNIIFQYIYKQ